MNKLEYVKEYYDKNYGNGDIDKEIEAVGKFLVNNARGKVLDCGCGPVPQIWAICMPEAKEIYAIDLPKESIEFVKEQLKTKGAWNKNFISYQRIVEAEKGKLLDNYILNQINKLVSIRQADMTKPLPFPEQYFDTIVSLYSLGVLRDEVELNNAMQNISKILKRGGKLLHINTNGKNKNDILPEYTWRGLSQMPEKIISLLQKHDFIDIKVKKCKINTGNGMYAYNNIYLISAVKK